MMAYETMEEIIKKTVRDACPADEECVEDEKECLTKHPIHYAGMTNGVVDSVYADVDGMAAIIADALADAGFWRELGD